MSGGSNVLNQLSALHREIDLAKEEVRGLEQQQGEIRRQMDEKWRLKCDDERSVCHQPNATARITEIRQQHQTSIAPVVAELT